MLFQRMGKAFYGAKFLGWLKRTKNYWLRSTWVITLVQQCSFQISTSTGRNRCTRVSLSMFWKGGILSASSPLAMRVTRCVSIFAFVSVRTRLTKQQLHPLTGQGGNTAIETSAALTNHLVTALAENHLKPLSTEQISSIFENTQRQRQGRATNLVESAHNAQRFASLDTQIMKFAVRYFVPYLPTSLVASSWATAYCPVVSLNMLSLPKLPRKVPFHDELP